jgi:cellulose synthase (UDP-forming)
VYRNQGSSIVAIGAAEETYAYYSVTQMASYGMGEPVLTGCHSVHRLSALRQFGGFPEHAAEDILQTAYYHARGWQGVYVPEVLATGLAPVGWSEYFTQQIRWARSVLDIKFRQLRKLRGSNSRRSLIENLQGFGYLQDAILGLGTLAFLIPLLAYGAGEETYTHLRTVYFGILTVAIFITDLFRQHYYLRRSEVGIHWRAGLLRLAKWPLSIVSLWLVLRDKPFRYIVTPKVKSQGTRSMMLLPHGLITALVAGAWLVGFSAGSINDRSLHVLTVGIVSVSLGLILMENI